VNGDNSTDEDTVPIPVAVTGAVIVGFLLFWILFYLSNGQR